LDRIVPSKQTNPPHFRLRFWCFAGLNNIFHSIPPSHLPPFAFYFPLLTKKADHRGLFNDFSSLRPYGFRLRQTCPSFAHRPFFCSLPPIGFYCLFEKFLSFRYATFPFILGLIVFHPNLTPVWPPWLCRTPVDRHSQLQMDSMSSSVDDCLFPVFLFISPPQLPTNTF